MPSAGKLFEYIYIYIYIYMNTNSKPQQLLPARVGDTMNLIMIMIMIQIWLGFFRLIDSTHHRRIYIWGYQQQKTNACVPILDVNHNIDFISGKLMNCGRNIPNVGKSTQFSLGISAFDSQSLNIKTPQKNK